jgi:aryl-alcohol dehydrogenase-like predicted oxidoreductase
VSVQNRYNLVDREWEAVLEHCEHENLGFIPWFPIATGQLARPGGPLDTVARELGATPALITLSDEQFQRLDRVSRAGLSV